MPLMPMMPTGDPMASPSPGPPSGEGMPPGGPDMSGLMGMLGGGATPPMGGPPPASNGSTVPSGAQMGLPPEAQMLQAAQQIMAQFQQIEQMVMDLAGMLPGTEQVAEEIMQSFDLWKRQAVMTMAPQPQAMPGASQMM